MNSNVYEVQPGFQPSEHDVRVQVRIRFTEYWEYCSKNLETGTWRAMIPFSGFKTSFIFNNPEDATAFKLKFDIRDEDK